MLTALLAPAWYWLLGAGLFAIVGGSARLAPLAGCVAAGWLAELSFLCGIDPTAIQWCSLLVAACILLVRRRLSAALTTSLPLLYLAYLPALGAQLLAPYPGVCHWHGDYLEYLAMAQALATGDFPPGLLMRPPIFGGAALPLLRLTGGLAGLQLFAAVGTAATVLALAEAAERLAGRAIPRQALAVISLTPLFLLHTVTLWPKLLAGACLVASIVGARTENSSRGGWAAAGWFAAAVACHTSSALFLPLLWASRAAQATWRRDIVILALMLALLVGPFEFWTVWRFGGSAKVASNPALRYQRTHGPVGTVAANLAATFTGWPDARHWNPADHRFPVLGHWHAVIVLLVTWQAGTFLGLMLPFAPTVYGRWSEVWILAFANRWAIAAAGFVVLANAALNPLVSASGVTQTGLVGLCLLVLTVVLPHLPNRASSLAVVLMGTLPFAFVHAAAAVAVTRSDAARILLDTSQRNAFGALLVNGLQTICLAGFPVAPFLGGALLVATTAFALSGNKAAP